ncbi:MAG: AI-2E family transporter [Chitinophagaceae bacterium]|nr:AI-2E family transporter [Chitinophagaceae bacterium]
MKETPNDPMTGFRKKVWTALSIAALFIIIIWIIKISFNVLLLVLAGALIALYFHGLSGLLHRNLRLPEKISLLVSILGSFLLLFLFFWFAGDRVQQQFKDLGDTLPSAFENFKERLNESPAGREVMDRVSSGANTGKISSFIQSFFRSTFGVIGDIYVVLFLGIFFTASPSIYIDGMLKLVPPKAREEADKVVKKVGFTLTKWLKGQLFSMFVVFALTAIGLAIIGVPLWLVLSLIAGLLSFIPNFGPLIALIPAVLVGLMQSPTTALLIAGLYILVQALESNLIMPQIQKKLINMPPAVIILAQLFMGVLIGGWGLILATPLVAIIIVLVQELYIKKQEENE